jgi:iron(III) transport system substrate-binding protein
MTLRCFVVIGHMRTLTLALVVLGATSLYPTRAVADGSLVVYCSALEEWCRATSTAFQRETGIKVLMTRKSAGEVYAQIKAEASNPRADIWWSGSGDPFLQAAEEGLTEEYKSPRLSEQHDWAIRQWEQSRGRAVGIYSGALGFGYDIKLWKATGLPEPACWADLLNPKLRDEIQVADPNSSGTAYNLLATMVQLMGKEKGFDYLKALHHNINQYTKSGGAPAQALGLGETTVGIAFLHDLLIPVVAGAPVKVVALCEGTGYEIGSMAIIKGARNLENAKKWYDWALSAEAQEIGAKAKSYQVPSNKNAAIPAHAPDYSKIKFINYDFAKYGSAEERRRLLSKWDNEIKNQPK